MRTAAQHCISGSVSLATIGLFAACLGCSPSPQSPNRIAQQNGIYANADTCEPSEQQLAADKQNLGSKKSLWRVATHYNLCVMNLKEAKVWLQKLAEMNDPNAMAILGAYAEHDGDKSTACRWYRRADAFGFKYPPEMNSEPHSIISGCSA
jgi:TPR repeat protein